MRLVSSPTLVRCFRTTFIGLTMIASLPWLDTARAQTQQAPAAEPSSATGPVRLRQPPDPAGQQPAAIAGGAANGRAAPLATPPGSPVLPTQPPATRKPSEFEAFVGLPLFGRDLVTEMTSGAADYSPIVPPEYIVQTGDELQLTLWGSIDSDLRLTVDRAGRVTIPRVGPVMVVGLRYADLHDVLTRRIGQVFKNFDLSVSLGRIRGVRVYVTGFVERPGTYAVPGLSSVLNAVMLAGGPAATGTFRAIELRRGGKIVATLDLYDLVLRGDRTADRLVEPDDVVHVPAVGSQVAIRGSVNKPAVFEIRPQETLADVLRMAGGLNAVADRSRVAIERLEERASSRIEQYALTGADSLQLANGDVVRVFSRVEASLSVERQNKRIRIEGEVRMPGEYVLPPNSTMNDALRAAGGITPSAYVFGTVFTRESVRQSQQENYERALRDLETDFARSAASQRVSSGDDASNRNAQATANTRLIERLRQLAPNGRVVFQLPPGAGNLPDILLEDGDRIAIPPRPTSVGVFGSVFNAGNYLYGDGRTIDDYLRLAGGPTKGSDESSIFVIRANGQVSSSRQTSSFFNRRGGIGEVRVEPGDTVFVPEEMDKTTFLQAAKDWTQILYQLGVGAAGIASAVR